MNASALDVTTLPAVRISESMTRHTSWRVGGPADLLCVPRDLDELREFLAALDPQLPIYWVGLGSNLLVRDAGIRGAVVITRKVFNSFDLLDDGAVRVGAGVACTQLARRARISGLGGAEFFAGIPGTVGGALAMNAGAFGSETWDFVDEVYCINRAGDMKTRRPDDYSIDYREVNGPKNEWFCGAQFRFGPRDTANDQAMTEMLERRKSTQPLGLPSCGSVFRNPAGDHAARLIEANNLKGTQIGGAEVSPKHANFIINTGAASADDIERLIDFVQRAVKTRAGVELRHEVRMVGERA